jgi:nifR3 family TIM-barrel protein
MSYTEFIGALEILNGHPRIGQKLAFSPEERPIVYQIFDNDPDRLLEVALRLQDMGPDIIDINLGCSSKAVSSRGAGAGLLRTPLKVARIFRRLSQALTVPLTGKIRLGWDDECRNYPLIARIIEENGGQLIAVHGRTKAQGYGGQADWDAIAEIRQLIGVPVIGNGDVRTVADIEKMKAYTGCPAVMIARGAIGNPWIFSGLDRTAVTYEQVKETMLTHLDGMLAFYGPERGLILFRKHANRYISPYRLPNELRKQLLTSDQPDDFVALLDEIVQLPVLTPGN